jgi:hypothetical protein
VADEGLSPEAQNVVDRTRNDTLRPEDFDALPDDAKRKIVTEIEAWVREDVEKADRLLAERQALPRSQRRTLKTEIKQLRSQRSKLAGALEGFRQKLT